MIASSGPRRYAKPAPPVGCTPFAFASAMPAFVRPSTPPVPGQVSALVNTVAPASSVYSGSNGRPRCTYMSRLLCTSVTCHPKCQNAVCGSVAGGASTLLNRTQTLFGDFSAGFPANVAFDVLVNALV